jgi:hypothetical protein
MIYLDRKPVSVFKVDHDLVIEYKRTCDGLLINIRRNLTKQLIIDKVYYDLQQVNDSYYNIIYKLLNDLYDEASKLDSDYKNFISTSNVFVKNCEAVVPDGVKQLVIKDVDRLKLAMQRLIYILENICNDSEDNF